LTVKDAAVALAFYKKAFGAIEVMRLNMPDAKWHMQNSKSATRIS